MKNLRKLPASKKRDVFSRSGRDAIISRLNPLQEIIVSTGPANKVEYGDEWVRLQFNTAGASSPGTSGGNMIWRGLYSGTTDYAVDSVVYTGATVSTRRSFICEIANGPSTSVHAPDATESGTIYWRLIEDHP